MRKVLHDGATATAVGSHLDLSRQRVGQLADEGVFSRNANGLYDLDNCRLAYIRWIRDDQRRTTKSASTSRVQDARAREIELRMARDAHRLIETDEAIAVCDEIVGTYKAELAGLPARVTRDMGLRQTIETEIDDICRRVADRLEQRASDLRSSGEAGTSDAEDDA
jgi:phage terminase Nu1 subunit (DNA packaging protein)